MLGTGMQSTMDVQVDTILIDQLQLQRAQYKSTGDWIYLAEEASFEFNADFTAHDELIMI